jgi:hypothetical protein
LNITAAIQIVTKKPAKRNQCRVSLLFVNQGFISIYKEMKTNKKRNATIPCKCCLINTTKSKIENGSICSIHLATCCISYLWYVDPAFALPFSRLDPPFVAASLSAALLLLWFRLDKEEVESEEGNAVCLLFLSSCSKFCLSKAAKFGSEGDE